jgi:hypothetical protein
VQNGEQKMLNLFSKTKPWMVASLLAATLAVTAQDTTKNRPAKSYEQGHEVQKNQLMPAYNAPAAIDVRGSWDVYVTGSFLYWQAREDNLDLGIVSNGFPVIDLGGPFMPNTLVVTPAQLAAAQTTGYVANANFNWGPGFKVALGVNLDYDTWDAYAEYTWFHKTSHTNLGVQSRCEKECGIDLPNNEWIFPTRMMPVGITLPIDNNKGYKSASQKWTVKMDFLDLVMARSYYSGTRLSFRPLFGARGAWIRQSVSETFNDQATFTGGALVPNAAHYATYSGNTRAWGVGPMVGMKSNWMLGYGFRLIGDVEADILYTRYDVKSKGLLVTEYDTNPLAATPVFAEGSSKGTLSQKHTDMLRPHADIELGFGWGSYFDNSNWHVDLLATYGYQVFWNQNMFINFSESLTGRLTNGNGNLYVHGMTFTARFDF